MKETKATIIDKETKEKIIKFHDSICDKSHTDECGWYYEIVNGEHVWESLSHQSWASEYLHAKNVDFRGYYIKQPFVEN